MVRCSGVEGPCSWSRGCGQCGCIVGELEQVTISCCCERGRCCDFGDLVALIPGTFDVDEVGVELSCETEVVPCPLVVPGVISFAFTVLSFSACFR